MIESELFQDAQDWEEMVKKLEKLSGEDRNTRTVAENKAFGRSMF